MRVLVVGRRVLGGRCLRVIASALSVLVLAAVPALGITRLGGDALSNWGARDGSPGAGPLADVAPSAGPLTFDAPACTAARHKAATQQANRGPAGAKSDRASVVELNDWTFTASTTDPAVIAALMSEIAFEQQEVDFDNQLAGIAIAAIASGQITPDIATRGIFTILAGQLIQDSFAADALGPDAAPLQALVQSFIQADQQLFQLGLTAPFFNPILFQQILVIQQFELIFLQAASPSA